MLKATHTHTNTHTELQIPERPETADYFISICVNAPLEDNLIYRCFATTKGRKEYERNVTEQMQYCIEDWRNECIDGLEDRGMKG